MESLSAGVVVIVVVVVILGVVWIILLQPVVVARQCRLSPTSHCGQSPWPLHQHAARSEQAAGL